MTYVARFTTTPKQDESRNWSGYMIGEYGLSDLYDFMSSAYITDRYEDLDDLEEGTEEFEARLQEIAEENDVIFDETSNSWRVWHHDGLSCWKLDSNNMLSAAKEAKEKESKSAIDWSGFGQRTHGKLRYVGAVVGVENLHIFECDYTTDEI